MKRDPISYVECSLPASATLAEYRRSRRPADRPARRRLRRMLHTLRAR
ncbi:MAG: hypothetical protein ACR2L8_00605 [Solirubrobacteraceae bacterium]